MLDVRQDTVEKRMGDQVASTGWKASRQAESLPHKVLPWLRIHAQGKHMGSALLGMESEC